MATATAEHAARMCASWWWAWRLGRGGRASAGAERARSAVRAHHLVCLHPIGEALRFDAAEITGASKPRVVGSMRWCPELPRPGDALRGSESRRQPSAPEPNPSQLGHPLQLGR
jgi:hypothetical protein